MTLPGKYYDSACALVTSRTRDISRIDMLRARLDCFQFWVAVVVVVVGIIDDADARGAVFFA